MARVSYSYAIFIVNSTEVVSSLVLLIPMSLLVDIMMIPLNNDDDPFAPSIIINT